MERDYRVYEPIFGSWYITKRIGTGGAGNVYEIERTDEFGVTFRSALKVITIPAGGDDEIKSVLFSGVSEEELKGYYEKIADNVANEFRCMAKLKGNGHIVSYEDHLIIAHEDDPGWDILMRIELLTPLPEYYRDRQMQESDILKMSVDLCKGLEFCHSSGIIHRDIKPENIFVAPGGDYKLGDFGIAKIIETTQSYLSRKGTFTYMAPEVYLGEPYNESADIYSLGMVLYQCLNDGRSIFMPPAPEAISHDDTEAAFAKRIVRRDVPLPAHGSDQLKQIVRKACAYDPSDRYQSAKEMRLDLEDLLLGTGRTRFVSGGKNKDLNAKVAGSTGNSKIRRIIAAAVIPLAAASALAYTLIPHEIESIDGIDDQNVLYIGDTMQPEYKISPDRFADEPITFTISDESVAGVDENGSITALSLGSADLTLAADEYTRSVNVTVIPKVTSIENIASLIELETGSAVSLSPELKPARFSGEEIRWAIEDPEIAGVSLESDAGSDASSEAITTGGTGQSVTVSALAAGSTTLKVESGGFTMNVPVKVSDPPPPPVYSSPGSTNRSYSSKSRSKTSKNSSQSQKNSSSGDDRGYFLDSDKEHF